MLLGPDIGHANLAAKIVTTQNHVFFDTMTMGAVVLSRYFSSSHAPVRSQYGQWKYVLEKIRNVKYVEWIFIQILIIPV